MSNTENKSVLITGGTSGLGRSLVDVFIENGWSVATFGRRQILLDEIKNSYSGKSILAEPCDMRIDGQVNEFFEKVGRNFNSIDVCILNAGTLGPSSLPEVYSLDMMDLRMTFETNFFSHFRVLKKCLDLRAGKQVLVHVTSDAVNGAFPGWGAYGASKAAMDFLIKTLNNEQRGDGLRAFSFDPGDMKTEMHRIALPNDTNLKQPRQAAIEIYEVVSKEAE